MVMEELGLDFEVLISNIDEKAIRRESPEELVLAIANAKADALLPKISKPSLLITSDQVVLYKNKIREKPASEKEARQFLESYAKAPATTVGAVVVVNTKTGKRFQEIQTSTVHFKPLPETVITAHIQSGAAMKGAGGFVIQDPLLIPFIEKIDGTFDSAAGLSKEVVTRLLNLAQA